LRKSHGLRSWQVGVKEMSASEPLTRCRNIKDDVKTGVLLWSRDKHGRYLLTDRVASGIKVA
jgi:hypothetical protein